ncbi:hypothetical protein [Seleniivibrio woodruffii]|nr:hypothetical protein [Seleniivibrio woodruffii]
MSLIYFAPAGFVKTSSSVWKVYTKAAGCMSVEGCFTTFAETK